MFWKIFEYNRAAGNSLEMEPWAKSSKYVGKICENYDLFLFA